MTVSDASPMIEDEVSKQDSEIEVQKGSEPEGAVVTAPVTQVESDKTSSQGVGRRKTASARVTIKPGSGKIVINERELKEYFHRQCLVDEIHRPFEITGTANRFDVSGSVSGSGLSSQAGAVRLAISRALALWQADFRPALSVEGLLTRDPRMVERKKYGIRGARRRPQWTKR